MGGEGIGMEELRQQRISVTAHTGLGLAMGFLSVFTGSGLYTSVAALAAVIVAGHAIQRAVGKNGFSWWFGNGLFIYFFVWIDTWIFIANTMQTV